MAAVYDVGDGIYIVATFRDLTGTAADPTSVTFRLKDPTGTVTTPSVLTGSTGVYAAEFTVTRHGTWAYRWEGTGAVQAAEEGKILVRASNFS